MLFMFNTCLAEGDAVIHIGLYELSLLSLGSETSTFEKTQRLDSRRRTTSCPPDRLVDRDGIFGEDLLPVLNQAHWK